MRKPQNLLRCVCSPPNTYSHSPLYCLRHFHDSSIVVDQGENKGRSQLLTFIINTYAHENDVLKLVVNVNESKE